MADFDSKLVKKLVLKHGSKINFEENPDVLQDIIRQVRADASSQDDIDEGSAVQNEYDRAYDRGYDKEAYDRSYDRYDREF